MCSSRRARVVRDGRTLPAGCSWAWSAPFALVIAIRSAKRAICNPTKYCHAPELHRCGPIARRMRPKVTARIVYTYRLIFPEGGSERRAVYLAMPNSSSVFLIELFSPNGPWRVSFAKCPAPRVHQRTVQTPWFASHGKAGERLIRRPPWYGPVCPVVLGGRHRKMSPYPDGGRLIIGLLQHGCSPGDELCWPRRLVGIADATARLGPMLHHKT